MDSGDIGRWAWSRVKSRSRVQSTGPPVLRAASAGRERRVCRRIALYNTKTQKAYQVIKLSRPTPRERYCSLCRYLGYITCIDGDLLTTSARLYQSTTSHTFQCANLDKHDTIASTHITGRWRRARVGGKPIHRIGLEITRCRPLLQ